MVQFVFVSCSLCLSVFCVAAPVVKIRQSLTKLKQEIEQMDVRMGVVEHTLLQAKLREKNNMTRDMHATHLLEPNAQTYWVELSCVGYILYKYLHV